MASRTKNSKRNIVVGLLKQFVILLFPFVTRTIILRVLGNEYLGVGSLFTSILQVLNVAELGITSAIIVSLYKPIAENDTEKICALMRLYRFVYKIIGLIILVAGATLLFFLPHLIKGSYPNDLNLYTLFLLYLFNTVISYLAFAYKSVLLTAHQRDDIISWIRILLTVSFGVLQIVSLYSFKNYYVFYSVTILQTISNNIIVAVITKKKYPQYIPNGKLDKQSLHIIKKQIGGLAINKVSTTTRNSFDSIFLSVFCGLVDVAIYGNYYYILSAVLGIINVMIIAISASVGNSLATEDVEKNHNDFNKLNFYFCWIGSWCTICMFCMYQPFMKIWMNGDSSMLAPTFTVALFVAYFYVSQIGRVRSMYGSALGIWWKTKVFAIMEIFLNISLNVLLGYFFGMNGIILATIISVTFTSVIMNAIVVFKEYFKIGVLHYFLTLFTYTIITLLVLALTYFLSYKLINFGNIYINLLLIFVLCMILPNILFVGIYSINKSTRNYMIFALKKIKRS